MALFYWGSKPLARITEPRPDLVDRDLNPALDAFVRQACAVAADQLDLKVVQWVVVVG